MIRNCNDRNSGDGNETSVTKEARSIFNEALPFIHTVIATYPCRRKNVEAIRPSRRDEICV